MLLYKKHIIRLFNEGVLTIDSADWYLEQGFALVCKDGKVINIIREGKDIR